MEVFNIVAGVCSIISLFISLFVANKVINISNTLNIDNSSGDVKQTMFGKNLKAAGRDMIER